jgi:predicted RNase H-like nuclease (RuvC/YqgF family)
LEAWQLTIALAVVGVLSSVMTLLLNQYFRAPIRRAEVDDLLAESEIKYETAAKMRDERLAGISTKQELAINALTATVTALQAENGILRAEQTRLNEENKSLRGELGEKTEQIHDLEEDMVRQRNMIDQLKAENKKLSKRIDTGPLGSGT